MKGNRFYFNLYELCHTWHRSTSLGFSFIWEWFFKIEGGSGRTARQWSIREDLLPFRSSWFEFNCSFKINERIRIDFSAEGSRWLLEGSPSVVIHHEYNPKHFKLIVPLCIHFLVLGSKRWHFFLVTLFNATQLHWDLSLEEVVFLERCFVQTKTHPISFSMPHHITFLWLSHSANAPHSRGFKRDKDAVACCGPRSV